MTRERKTEIIIHIACWLLVMLIPFLFVEHNGNSFQFNWNHYLHHCFIMLACAVLVYVNYLYLLPKLFFNQQRYALFWSLNAIFILALTTAITLTFRMWDLHTIDVVSTAGMPPAPIGAAGMPPMAGAPMSRPPHRPTFLPASIIFFLRDMSFLCLAFGIGFAVKLAMSYRRKEMLIQQFERMQIETELNQLRYQVNPHFLLNTLNNIYVLVAIDVEKAQKSILELSKMMRYVLYDNREKVPLVHDVHFIESYIDLMRLRLTDDVTLDIQIDIDEESTTQIAPMMLISLVENAFKHGIPAKGKSTIEVVIHEDFNGLVTCYVANCNYPKTDSDKSGSGVGLQQLRRRLNLIYPNHYMWSVRLSDDKKQYISELTINTKQ